MWDIIGMGENSKESLINKYNALIELKYDNENRLERITKLLEIISIEMGTIASVKVEGFAEDVKSQFEILKPKIEALKAQIVVQKEKAKAATTTALTRASGYGTGVVSNITNRVVSILGQNPPVAKGGKRIAASAATAYKSNGDKVHLLIDNKRLHRSIYVKGKAKYCKINNEFVLLSKLKNKIIE